MSDRIDDFASCPAAEQFHPVPYACYSVPQAYATMSDYFPWNPAAGQFHDPVPNAFDSALQGYIEDAEGCPSASSMTGHTRERRFERPINRYIPDLLCPERECLTTSGFLSSHGDKYGSLVHQKGVLISDLYIDSFMYEETALELDCKHQKKATKLGVDPRGDWFKTIGFSGIYVWLNGPSPVWVEFYILPGSGVEAGVRFILGRRDIRRIWGDGWTPQQYDEGMPMLPGVEMRSTFGVGDLPSQAKTER